MLFLIPVFWTVCDTATTAFAFPILQQQQRCTNHQQPKQQQRLSPRSFSSFTFGTGKIPCAVIPTPYFAENGDNNDSAKAAATDTTTNNDALKNTNDTVTGKSVSTSTKSTFQMIDELAQQLKVLALQANAKAALYTTTTSTDIGSTSTSRNNFRFVFTKYRYYFQACVCYTLFLLYRAYRGFFIILPAVFRETFRKLQNAVDDTPFDDNDSVTSSENTENKLSSSDGVIQPKPMTVRTRITISIISMFVLATYVMGGAIRVTTSLVKSIINGSSIIQSLQNAIQIQERNELTLLQKSSAATPNTDGSTRGPIVNGFAP